MLDKVADFLGRLLKIRNEEIGERDGNVIESFGISVYQLPRGYFGLIGDDGSCYYPFNSAQFRHQLHDRHRVHFVIEAYPDQLTSLHRWGRPVKLLALDCLGPL